MLPEYLAEDLDSDGTTRSSGFLPWNTKDANNVIYDHKFNHN